MFRRLCRASRQKACISRGQIGGLTHPLLSSYKLVMSLFDGFQEALVDSCSIIAQVLGVPMFAGSFFLLKHWEQEKSCTGPLVPISLVRSFPSHW